MACKRFSVKAREIADPNSQAVMVSVKLSSAVAALRFPREKSEGAAETNAGESGWSVSFAGGREHTLVNACVNSPLVKRTLAAPGNPGMAAICECEPVAADNIDGVVGLAESESVDFVIVGPEVPLCLGLVDRLNDKGILATGDCRPKDIFCRCFLLCEQ